MEWRKGEDTYIKCVLLYVGSCGVYVGGRVLRKIRMSEDWKGKVWWDVWTSTVK